MYRWLLYGHLLGVGLLVLGTGAYWIATEALLRSDRPAHEPGLLSIVEHGLRVVIVGGAVLLGFGVALASHLDVLSEPWVLSAFVLIGLQGVSGRVLAERPLRRLEAQAATGVASVGSDRDHAAARAMNAAARGSLPVLAQLELLMAVKPEPPLLAWSVIAASGLAAVLAWTGLRGPGAPAATDHVDTDT